MNYVEAKQMDRLSEEQKARELAHKRFLDFVNDKATLLNRYLSSQNCHDADKVSTGLMWMVIGTCAAFERFVFEIDPTDDPKKQFKNWMGKRFGNNSAELALYEAYFSIRNALVHFGGHFEYLKIWCKHSSADGMVKKQLKDWGIHRDIDLFDLSEVSREVLENAWSGQVGSFKGWARSFSRLKRNPRNMKGVTGKYGYIFKQKVAGNWHLGIDFMAPAGTPVYAAGAGTVIFSGQATDCGRAVWVRAKLPNGSCVCYVYLHLRSQGAIANDAIVAEGTKLGYVGSFSQNGGWAPHLHFGVRSGSTYPPINNGWGYTTSTTELAKWNDPAPFLYKG